MVRKILVLAAACGLVAFSTGNALADDDMSMKGMGMYVELDGLVTIQSLDEQQSMDKFNGPITIDFDDSWGIQARGGIVFSDNLSAEAMIEYIAPFEAITGADSDEIDAINFGVNGRYGYPMYEGKLVPYLLAGISAMNVFEEINYGGALSKTSDWGIGVRGGVGADYFPAGDIWSYRLEAAYVAGLGDVDHVRYTTISLGLAYHF